MKYRLIQTVEGRMLRTEGDIEDVIAVCEARGFEYLCGHVSAHTRAELQGQPEFTNLHGPMWDGDAIRYEDWAAYRALSE